MKIVKRVVANAFVFAIAFHLKGIAIRYSPVAPVKGRLERATEIGASSGATAISAALVTWALQ
jgi:hypothetical protein